jgi:phasin family protein
MAAPKNNSSAQGYTAALATWYTTAPEITRKNIAALSAAGKLYAELVQTLAKRHQELTHNTLSQTSSAMKDILNTGHPSQRLTKQLELGKQSFQTYLAGSEEVAELVTRSNRAVATIFTRRTAELIDETKAQIEKTTFR